MKNHIYTNCQLILDKIYFIVNKLKKIDKLNTCPICKMVFKHVYISKYFKIYEYMIHMLSEHNLINVFLYKKVLEYKIKNYPISWYKMTTNNINILDGLYNVGGNDIYIKTGNFYGKTMFSEHAGFIYFKNNNMDKISVLTDYRVDVNDPIIFLPENSKEAFKVNYVFHTHPTTPYIGSRIKHNMIYEFPSLGDIGHFIEHHNNGILDGSIVITPEGIYIIRKYNFNNKKIRLDFELFMQKLRLVYRECYKESSNEYKNIDKKIIKGEIQVLKNDFYNKVAINFKYINKINEFLSQNDLYIDYYPRIHLKENDWVFRDIYVPFL